MHIKKSLDLLDAKIDKTLHEIADSRQLPTRGQLETLHFMLECRKHIPAWKREYCGEDAAKPAATDAHSPTLSPATPALRGSLGA